MQEASYPPRKQRLCSAAASHARRETRILGILCHQGVQEGETETSEFLTSGAQRDPECT